MDKIIEAILKLIPFSKGFQLLGINKELSAGLSVLLTAIILYFAGKFLKNLVQRKKYEKEAKNLYPQFDYKSIKEATEYYIPTQFQNASPTRQEEPRFSHKYITTNKLIPFFLKTAFNMKRESERFYLILADSGMGKTTFMINLYLNYISFWNRHRDKTINIKLFRLGEKDTLDLVKNIKREEAINTILLLDALDEDPFIIPAENSGISDETAFNNRVEEIIKTTKNFREVVLTCRTQYFPGQENDPYELTVKRPDEKGYYTLNKLYISPFNDKEIKQYLNKKYPFYKIWLRKRKQRAERIVKSSPHLIVRPMLLSYIDLLTEDEKKYDTVYSIYENLIEKWLIREAEKRKPKKERTEFIKNLRKVSQQTALEIYTQRKTNGGLFLTKEQANNVALQNQIELKPDEVTGKSLLTCDGQGNWKFAHKSILEFFLAKHAVENLDFFMEFAQNNFASMDMMKTFYEEIYPERKDLSFIKGGTFKQENRNVTLSDYFIGKYPVTQKLWREVTGSDPKELRFKGCDNCPVESINWYEAVEFCNKLSTKYNLAPYYTIDKNTKDPNNKNEEYDKLRYLVRINKNAKGFSLPSEAEWEFAARGGIKSKDYEYAGSNNIDEVAWYDKNSKRKTHSVGGKKPNELGIYDMSGNVWEWCYDWCGDYKKNDIENPQGTLKGSYRVFRGGRWIADASYCRVADRDHYNADYRYFHIGFRIALSL